MKKIFLAACTLALFMACNDQGSTTNADSTTDTTDRNMMTTTTYTPTEGDVTFKDHNVLIYKGDKWVPTEKSITMGNGVVVYMDGTVKNGEQTDTLFEGEIVSHTGDLYDQAGNAIHDAWDATKKGVNDAGDAVKEGADKAENEINKTGEAAGKELNTAGQAANKAVKDTKEALDKK
jgi:hypothetical protein